MEEAFTLTAAAPVAKKPFKAGDRWLAVKLKGRVEAPTADFAKVKEGLKQSVLPKKQQDALQAWLKDLRSKAKIEVNPMLQSDF
jgi:peptidyl-prolyl cis-trans isomerase D